MTVLTVLPLVLDHAVAMGADMESGPIVIRRWGLVCRDCARLNSAAIAGNVDACRSVRRA